MPFKTQGYVIGAETEEEEKNNVFNRTVSEGRYQ